MIDENEVNFINSELRKIDLKVDRILRTLIGDEQMKQEGWLDKVDQHGKWIERQKLVWAKVFGIAIGSGLFGGIVTQIVMRMLENAG